MEHLTTLLSADVSDSALLHLSLVLQIVALLSHNLGVMAAKYLRCSRTACSCSIAGTVV